jgi:TolB protein
MNRPPRLLLLLTLGSILLANAGLSQTAEDDLTVEKRAGKRIPISLSGYSGEPASVLRFDLEVAGFEVVTADAAEFNVTGNNSSAVEGQVAQRSTKALVLDNRRYSGGNLRFQAHAFADDIVAKILNKPGIARTKIAFIAGTRGVGEIYVADYDGANAMPVTQDHVMVAAPGWVPGQRTLYYTSYKSGWPDVYAQNLTTGDRKVIARYPGLNTSPAVSPNGRQVALILSRAGSPDLYVCDAEGGNLRQLTKSKEDESSPCWSPDGRKICFCSRMGGSPSLYTISPDGSNLKRLGGLGGSATEPDWSPDGKTILFTAIRGRGFELCTIPADGSGGATGLVAGLDGSWAPNSRTVIFTRQDNGRQILSLLDVITKRYKDVAQTLRSCSQPSWAR